MLGIEFGSVGVGAASGILVRRAFARQVVAVGREKKRRQATEWYARIIQVCWLAGCPGVRM